VTPGAAVISLITGLEDPEKVTVAMLVAVGAAEGGRETVIFLTKEAVRLVLPGHAVGVACEGCPSLMSLIDRFATAGGRFLVCPICFNSRQLDQEALAVNAALGGTVQLWEWIGERPVTTFSY
jgi:predicted peroxiredoxin